MGSVSKDVGEWTSRIHCVQSRNKIVLVKSEEVCRN